MIKLFTVLFMLVLTLCIYPQKNNFDRMDFSYPIDETLSGRTEISSHDASDEFEQQDKPKKDPPKILELNTELNDDEVMLSWVIQNDTEIFQLRISKIIAGNVIKIPVEKLDKGSMFTEYEQIDELTKEEQQQKKIIYRLEGTDSSGAIIVYKQITVEPASHLSEYELLQNYPNPFNPVTTIKFKLPSQEYVSLKVFNILGNQVTALLEETMPAGVHEVEFNGSQHTSGVYLYTIKTNNYSETKRMVLMK